MNEAQRLRIFVGESDKVHHTALHEAIVRAAQGAHLAGATAWRGSMGFGRKGHLRTDKSMDLSADLPMVIEIVDTTEKIRAFLPVLQGLLDQAGSRGLVTLDTVHVLQGP